MDSIIHGANPENLFRFFNIAIPEKILDFSTNTNVLSWPKISLNLEQSASNYPDPECGKLREIISEREKVPASKILFTNGINQAIFLLAGLFEKNTAILQPCYGEFSRAFRKAESIFSVDDAKNFSSVIICNPNNPTGRFIPDLSRIIDDSPKTLFIIDESYTDFLTFKKTERLADFRNAVILRSLTKIFHLSGARIGYVIADENIIDAMKKNMPSWSVNAIAQELAAKFLVDNDFLRRTKNFYRLNAPLFMKNLRLLGFDVIDSDVNFFLIRTDDDYRVIRFLLTKGIAVRHTRNFDTLEGKYIRVSVRTAEENKIFVEAMREFLQEKK